MRHALLLSQKSNTQIYNSVNCLALFVGRRSFRPFDFSKAIDGMERGKVWVPFPHVVGCWARSGSVILLLLLLSSSSSREQILVVLWWYLAHQDYSLESTPHTSHRANKDKDKGLRYLAARTSNQMMTSSRDGELTGTSLFAKTYAAQFQSTILRKTKFWSGKTYF